MGTVLSSVKYTPDGRVLLPLLLVILLLGVPYYGLNDFKDLQRLASGVYGIVFKGYSTVEKDGVRRKQYALLSSQTFLFRTVAVKTFLQSDVYSEREILILKTVRHKFFSRTPERVAPYCHFPFFQHSHPNIVEIFGVIWDGKAIRDRAGNEKPIYTGYVMEYMELGSLHKGYHLLFPF